MDTIISTLQTALTECNKVIAENVKIKKEYEAKFNDLSGLDDKLKARGIELDTREKKIKYVENVVEYSADVATEAKKAKEDSVAVAKAQKALQIETAEFNILKKTMLQEIKNSETANKKQAEALIAEKKAVDKDKEQARKIIASVQKV